MPPLPSWRRRLPDDPTAERLVDRSAALCQTAAQLCQRSVALRQRSHDLLSTNRARGRQAAGILHMVQSADAQAMQAQATVLVSTAPRHRS